MTLNLTIPPQTHTDFTPRITVIGVGGGGTNAVDNMIMANLQGVEFVVANTDAQQLIHSRANRRIQLGPHITQGLGAGAKPEIGRAAAEEAADELYRHLDGCHMVFVTAGMGGGTGTGAAPVIARMARERNILTVGVVTKPFSFEGTRRARAADQGIEELQQYVDTLIVIPNQNLFRMANERTTWREAFKMADQVLYMGVRGVTDLMMAPGLVNLDFADIRTVMAEMGKAMMGTGEADGENRAIRAAEAAISNPLLEDTSMSGARGLLINITGGDDMTLFEVDQAANRIREEVDEDANIIFGSSTDESLAGRMRVSVVATGIDTPKAEQQQARPRLVAIGGSVGAPQPVAIQPGSGQGPGYTMQAHPTQGHQAAGHPVQAHSTHGLGHALAGHPVMVAQHPAAPVPLRPSMPPAASAVEPSMEQFAAMHAEPVPAPAPTQAPMRLAPLAPRPQAARSGGLFAEPSASGGALAPEQTEPARPSLFGQVTGVLLRRRAAPPPAEPAGPRAQPVAAEPRAEPSPATVRPVAGEEMGIEIPTFLRRQSS